MADSHPSRTRSNVFHMLAEDSPRAATEAAGLEAQRGRQPVIQSQQTEDRDSGQGWVLARQRSGSQSQQQKTQQRSDSKQQVLRYSKEDLLALRKPSKIIPRMAGLEEIVSQEPLEPVSHGPFPTEQFSRIWNEGGAIRGRGRGRGGRGGRGMDGMRNRSGSTEHGRGDRRGSEDLWDTEPGGTGDRTSSDAAAGVFDLSDMAKAALQFKSDTLSHIRDDIARLPEHDVLDDLITREAEEDEIDPTETFGDDSALNDIPDPNLTFGQAIRARNGTVENDDFGLSVALASEPSPAVAPTSNILEQLRSLTLSGTEGTIHLSSTHEAFQQNTVIHQQQHHHQHVQQQHVQQHVQLSPQAQQPQVAASIIASSPILQGLAGPMAGGALGVQQTFNAHTSYDSHVFHQSHGQLHHEEFHHHQHAQLQMHMQQQQRHMQQQQHVHQQFHMSYDSATIQQQQQQHAMYQQPRPVVQPVQSAQWFYRDPRGRVQGPFDSSGMRSWFTAGYFKVDLPIKQQHWRDFHPLCAVFPDPTVAFAVPVSEPGFAVQDPMAALHGMRFGAQFEAAPAPQQLSQQIQQPQIQQPQEQQPQIQQQQQQPREQAPQQHAQQQPQPSPKQQQQQQAAPANAGIAVPGSPERARSVEELEQAAWADISEMVEQQQRGTAPAPALAPASAPQPRPVAAKPAPWAHAAQAKGQQKSLFEIQQEEAQARSAAAQPSQPAQAAESGKGEQAAEQHAALKPAKLPELAQPTARQTEQEAARQQATSPWGATAGSHKRTKSLKEIQEEEAAQRRAQQQAQAAAAPAGAGASDAGSMSIQLKSLLGVQSSGAAAAATPGPWGAPAAAKPSAKSLKEIQEEEERQRAEMARRAPAPEAAQPQPSASGPVLTGTWNQPKQRAGPSLQEIMAEQAQSAPQVQQPKVTYVPRPAANTWAAKAAGSSYNPSSLRAAESRPAPAVAASAKPAPAAAISRPEDEVDMFWNFQDSTAKEKSAPAPTPATKQPVAASRLAEAAGAKKTESEMMKWCAEQMQALRGDSDVSLLQVPMSMDNAVEIREFLADVLGSTPQVSQFATEFIRRRGLGGHAKSAASEEFQEAGKKKKKKNRGQRIDLA